MKRIITTLLLAMVITLGTASSYAEVSQEFEPNPTKEIIQGDVLPNPDNPAVVNIIKALIHAGKANLPRFTPETDILHLPILWIDGEPYTDVIIILHEDNTWTME